MPMGALSDPIAVHRCEPAVEAVLEVPGSKSISCRALVLAAMAEGRSTLSGLLRGDDTDALAAALAAVGVGIDLTGDEAIVRGGEPLVAQGGRVDLGHGGTPARFMLAVASLGRGDLTIDGSPRLRERPMQDMIDLLTTLGVAIEATGTPGHLPLRVVGGPWRRASLEVDAMASSQFLSALLLVAPRVAGGLDLHLRARAPSEPYLQLTIDELKAWNVAVSEQRQDDRLSRVTVPHAAVAARHRIIPADASSALFWASAAAITPRSSITVPRLSLDDGQPDAEAFSQLAAMGLQIAHGPEGLRLSGPDRLVSVETIDCTGMPDAAPALAVACCFAQGRTRLTGLQTLRHKESDRVATIAGELGRAGADVTIEGDDLCIRPVDLPNGPVTIQTWDDHRIAMALAIFGLRRGGLLITDPACVAKSYPGFWDHLARLYGDARSGDTA
jgi:3-phosphoshikimate 1-carboxyvinyltransferase